MAASPTLYNRDILQLTIALADYPLTDEHAQRATRQSRVCGSSVTIGYRPDDHGAIGTRTAACAIGQAATALFVSAPQASDPHAVESALDTLKSWLAGSGDMPDWPGIAALAPALSHQARHAAILLPWQAGLAALCKTPPFD